MWSVITGKEAQRSNIMAAKAIAGAVRTTLGPRGMDKMLVRLYRGYCHHQ